MNHGTTASLICPACGQAFLSMQHAMESTTQCPHCAHTAPRAHFGTQAQVAGVAQVRRRVAQAQPPQEIPHMPQPAPQFQPQPQPPTWQPAPPPQIARGILQYSQALMPVHAPPPPAEYVEPHRSHHHSASPWRGVAFMLMLMGVGGVGLWLWWNHSNTTAPAPKSEKATSQPPPAPEVRKTEVIIPPPPEVRIALQDTQAFAADAKALVNAFFAATTPEARAACVHEGAKHSAEIETLFGPDAPQKIELRQLAHLPSVIQALPGNQHIPLFKLITSQCATGALLRLEAEADGKRRISWPLLMETHQDALGRFLRQKSADPAWFYVAMRPSHGLDLPADVRPKYLTFDMQTSAASEPHFVGCVERDTPLARFLDRGSDWGKVYLSRLLVRPLEVEADAPCVVILDCEGSVER